MAVTVSGTPTQTVAASASSLTWAWNNSASATGLFVGGANQEPQLFSSCTYNGVGLTELWDAADDIGIQQSCGYLMVSPATGSNNVVLTAAASAGVIWGGAVGLAGLETGSGVGGAHRTVYTNNEAGGGAPSVTVADSQNGDFVIDCAITLNATIAVGTGQTSQVEDDALAGGSSSAGISTEDATGANTVMSWTGGSFWVTGATALIASGGGGGGDAVPVCWPSYRWRRA